MKKRRIKKLIKSNVNFSYVARYLSRHRKCIVMLLDDSQLIFNIVSITSLYYVLIVSYNTDKTFKHYSEVLMNEGAIGGAVYDYLCSL